MGSQPIRQAGGPCHPHPRAGSRPPPPEAVATGLRRSSALAVRAGGSRDPTRSGQTAPATVGRRGAKRPAAPPSPLRPAATAATRSPRGRAAKSRAEAAYGSARWCGSIFPFPRRPPEPPRQPPSNEARSRGALSGEGEDSDKAHPGLAGAPFPCLWKPGPSKRRPRRRGGRCPAGGHTIGRPLLPSGPTRAGRSPHYGLPPRRHAPSPSARGLPCRRVDRPALAGGGCGRPLIRAPRAQPRGRVAGNARMRWGDDVAIMLRASAFAAPKVADATATLLASSRALGPRLRPHHRQSAIMRPHRRGPHRLRDLAVRPPPAPRGLQGNPPLPLFPSQPHPSPIAVTASASAHAAPAPRDAAQAARPVQGLTRPRRIAACRCDGVSIRLRHGQSH